MANRHEHFINELDTQLNLITGLEVLDIFDLDAWMEYSFPYAHVELSPETLEYVYEDYFNEFEGSQDFVIWVGVEGDRGETLRSSYGELVLSIEKNFKQYKMNALSTADFDLHIKSTKLNGIYPVLSGGETKYIFLLSGSIHYQLKWL